ncbi:polyprenyl synthetase family protein [Listeria costaricensis]|uniref:polyprenyl synthetase family protein n=1 Tax=Listeria costaricensis TaxID=2026604 RepID=UPI001F09F7F6|nr:farnesyl diphosphate synthase [Listeria costaricensis]
MTIQAPKLITFKQQVEENLQKSIPAEVEPVLREAMLYSLAAGGKRIRPLLVAATIDALGGDLTKGLAFASAIEMVHTYSLIHDDLPAMDDDDFRRGKPTSHRVYGEATAILAGDALLTQAFAVLSADNAGNSAAVKLALVELLASSAGPLGMVGGQQADILAEKQAVKLPDLVSIHARKTGALLKASVLAGAHIGGATEEQFAGLATFAAHIGVAFQICDDILDVVGDENKLGKKTGADLKLNKSTYPALLTLEGAKKALEAEYQQALEALLDLQLQSDLLLLLAEEIIRRDN